MRSCPVSLPSGKHFKTEEAALTPGRRMLEKIQVWGIGTLCTVMGMSACGRPWETVRGSSDV